MIALLLSSMFMGYAKDVKSLQIVFTDIYMTTICRITPSYFDKGALRGICDTVSIVGTKKIKELVQAVNELQELYELSNQFKRLINRIIISRKPDNQVFLITHGKK